MDRKSDRDQGCQHGFDGRQRFRHVVVNSCVALVFVGDMLAGIPGIDHHLIAPVVPAKVDVIARLVKINALPKVTSQAVETARESLVIGTA